MKPEAPQLGTCETPGRLGAEPHSKKITCKNWRPVAAQPAPEAAQCPTCGSQYPKTCNGTGPQGRPHPHGRWEVCCKDSFHAAPSESVAPPKQTDDAMIQSSCPDKQIIWFHGTTRIAALVIEREGFKEGTWFAAHMEDALEFGGPIVFSVKVTFPPERAYAWQVCCINAIPASAIIKRTELFTVVGGIVAQTPVAQPTPPQVDTANALLNSYNLMVAQRDAEIVRLTAENQRLTRELPWKLAVLAVTYFCEGETGGLKRNHTEILSKEFERELGTGETK